VEVGATEVVDGVELTPVSVGNPHAVVSDDPERIGELGPRLEGHRRFPERTNVQVVRIERPGEVTARVWEARGGGDGGFGTSAVAVAAATTLRGRGRRAFPRRRLASATRGGGPGSRGRRSRSTKCRCPAGSRHGSVAGSPISSPPRAEGELPHPLGGVWVDSRSLTTGSGADLELAQDVVEARLEIRLLAPPPDDRAQATSYVPAGNSLGRVPGNTTARGGT
jgi:hypothetical protein